MPLGYVLKTEQVLAYYGLEREDVAEAIFKYGVDRKVIMTTEPGTLGGGGGQNGFRSPDEILSQAQEALEGMEGTVPRRYPAFHGTLARLPTDRRFMRRGQKGADLVMDIDVKGDYKEAFRDGRKILDFLDSYNAPYRVKFSGGSGPHIIIPYEAFPESLSGGRFDRAHKLLFQIVTSRSRASHVDGSFTSTGHFYRMPYSLNEITGLVSLPLTREQYDDFTPSMAEVPNVQVDDNWFREPDEEAREALMEILRDNTGRSRDFADIVRPDRRSEDSAGVVLPGSRAVPQVPDRFVLEKMQKRIERQVQRLKRLGETQAQEELIRKEEQKLREAMEELERKKHE